MEPRFCAFRPYDGGEYGMAALSRLPVLASEAFDLPPGPNPLRALELNVGWANQAVTIVGLHLVMTQEQRLAQAEFLLARYAEPSGAEARPLIFAGDLNSEPDDPVLARLASRFDRVVGTDLTFPAVAPVKEIDYVLTAPRGAWFDGRPFVVPNAAASDHRPVVLDVRWRGAMPD